jgi:hypothetical protein
MKLSPRVGVGQGAVMDWARILAYVTGTVDQELLSRNEYLAAENRILIAQLKGLRDDFSSLVAEDDQGIEKLKRCRYDNEHVDGTAVMPGILQERAPGRGGALGRCRPWPG